MTTAAPTADVVVVSKPKRVAGVIVTGHGFQHMYADGFLVLLPIIQDVFMMGPVALGILSASRQAAGGILSMGGGFMVDLFAGNRGIFLAGSLFSMGFAYLLAGVSPNAATLIIAVSLGSAAGSFWHPVGLGILSFTFPKDRALLMSLHRSAGSLGEVITPFIVAAALLVTTWSGVLVGGFFVIAIVSAMILFILARLGLPRRETVSRTAGAQFRSIGGLFTSRALPVLLIVSGLRGMADRAIVFFLPVLIAQLLREVEDDPSEARIAAVVAPYLALMVGTSIIVSPLIGAFSDRAGRKPVLVGVLLFSTVITGIMIFTAELGPLFLVLVGLLGIFRFAGANLAQAASLDVAEGRHIEGSMIGLLWGNNAFFGAFSPLLLGIIIAWFSPPGIDDYRLIFPYATVVSLLATVAALFLPPIGNPRRASA